MSGTRLTVGNGVECTKIRADDGRILAVHYLAPSVAIGARLALTGRYVKSTTCRGEVLFVEDLQLLDQP